MNRRKTIFGSLGGQNEGFQIECVARIIQEWIASWIWKEFRVAGKDFDKNWKVYLQTSVAGWGCEGDNYL